eukprot:TRINITY_DN41714_c0_g1_i1.p1 TRINITY_DN41714_c0_g1~~TRINITY_DN41714_c0_g1_i1.p1  ORF type:complete len:928 (+),score=208.54 TRINITY_DN41714_c0_g1_i1:158-2941(+)
MATVLGAMAAGMAPKIVKEVFSYNRENFMEDREQRMKKEFAERKYRCVQADLWREDVRDIVEQVESKMSLYLIINVLLLSFTVTLWVEGQLPETTPDWLVSGYQISCVVAFSFLILTIWLAMHAAIAAQSYQTRILTQLVRLPIPTWKELEACRTSASEFEKIEGRQMFRVPFVTGKQEQFVSGSTAALEDGSAEQEQEMSGDSGGWQQIADKSCAADPWGLEQRGDQVYELGCHNAEEIAQLRHIKLLRQASVYWQTYDAFARVSMSVGINQLMVAMSYFILGYGMLEMKSPFAAVAGVAAFMGSAEVITRVDLTLPFFQQRLVQILVAVGPLLSTAAAYIWAFHRETQTEVAEMLAPLAYVSNGIAIGIMTVFVHVEEQENGGMIPHAFKGVLYLDVFAGITSQLKGVKQVAEKIGLRDPSQAAMGCTKAIQQASARHSQSTKPAASGVAYDKYGNSLPSKASHSGPAGMFEDMRYTPGAPRSWDTVNAVEPPAKEFWDPVTFMPPESRQRTKFDELLSEDTDGIQKTDSKSASGLLQSLHLDNHPIITGHDNEAPGIVPWRIFRNFALTTTIFWMAAGALEFMRAAVPEFEKLGLSFDDEMEEHHHGPPRVEEELPEPVYGGSHVEGKERASLAEIAHDLSGSTFKLGKGQQIQPKWPYPGIKPKGLSCDAQGKHLLVTDGLSAFLAELQIEQAQGKSLVDKMRLRKADATLRSDFQQMPSCAPLLGESLQDTALTCKEASSSCEAFVLHRQGRRLASCQSAAGASQAYDVSSAWLAGTKERLTEKSLFLMMDPGCQGNLTRGCTSVGTTHGRSARLQLGKRGTELVPLDVAEADDVKSDGKDIMPLGMRALTERYVGFLKADGQRIDIMDLDRGGARVAKVLTGSFGPAAAFCTSADHLFILGQGAQPSLWRVPLPAALKTAQ